MGTSKTEGRWPIKERAFGERYIASITGRGRSVRFNSDSSNFWVFTSNIPNLRMVSFAGAAKEAVASTVPPHRHESDSFTFVEVLATVALVWYIAVVVVCTVGYTQL